VNFNNSEALRKYTKFAAESIVALDGAREPVEINESRSDAICELYYTCFPTSLSQSYMCSIASELSSLPSTVGSVVIIG